MSLQVIRDFMTAFGDRDFETMARLYTNDIQYFDPLFGYLKNEEVIHMWKLRYGTEAEFGFEVGEITDFGDGYYTAAYVVSWHFGKRNKPVVQKMKAHIRVIDGRIPEHSDAFSVHDWCTQCFGLSGKLLGWNRFYQQAVKNKIRRQLIGK